MVLLPNGKQTNKRNLKRRSLLVYKKILILMLRHLSRSTAVQLRVPIGILDLEEVGERC